MKLILMCFIWLIFKIVSLQVYKFKNISETFSFYFYFILCVCVCIPGLWNPGVILHLSLDWPLFKCAIGNMWQWLCIGQCCSRSFLGQKVEVAQHSATFEGIFPTSSNLYATCFIILPSILKRLLFFPFIIFLLGVRLSSKDLFSNFHCLCFLLQQFMVMDSYTKTIAYL